MRHRILLGGLLVAALAAGVFLLLRQDPAPRFAVSTAARPGAHVTADGWSVRLAETQTTGGRLALTRLDKGRHPWSQALADLTAGDHVSAGAPVHVRLARGRLGAAGAVLRRTLPERVPDRSTATLAYYDKTRDAWRTVPTRLLADRRTLRARVRHFSWWDDVVYDANWLLDTRVDAPTCEQPTPRWLRDTSYLDDHNAPIRWCAGHDPQNDDVLVVKLAVNRSYGVAVGPITRPRWTYTSLFGDGPNTFIANLVARGYALPDRLRRSFGGQVPVMGGQEAHFGFTEQQVRDHPEGALISVSPDVRNAVAGFTYKALVEATGAAKGSLGTKVAAVVALVAVAQCEAEIGGPLVHRQWRKAAKGGASCLASNADDVARDVATALALAFPKAEPKLLGKLSGKVVGKLWQIWTASAAFKLATWFADRHLNDAAFAFHAYPTIVRKPRPRPVPPTTTPEPAPEIEPPEETFGLGDEFSSDCVVAWPTAPVHTSQGIQMTMSCTATPSERFLFTQVSYADPDFVITPSTGAVHVTGQVVDVARSEYGYSVLLVEAGDVSK